MKWDFTPEDILNGKTHYSVAQFRDDLLKEIREVSRTTPRWGEVHAVLLYHNGHALHIPCSR